MVLGLSNLFKRRRKKRLSEIDKKEIEKLIALGTERSEKNQEIFESIDTLEDLALNDFYLKEIKPVIAESRALSKRFRDFESNFYPLVLQSSSLDGVYFDEFLHYYENEEITLYKDNETNFISADLYAFTGSPQGSYYRTDIKKYVENKKREILTSDWTVLITPKFKKSFKKISADVEKRALDCIETILKDPLQTISNTCKPLSGNKKGLWRYRFGDYRIIYEPDKDTQNLIFLDISDRSNAY